MRQTCFRKTSPSPLYPGGALRVHIGTDSDWIAKLIDVYPNDYPDPDPNPTAFAWAATSNLFRAT